MRMPASRTPFLRLALGATLLCTALADHAAEAPLPPAAAANAEQRLVAAHNAATRALAALYMRSLSGDRGLRPLWQKTSLTPNEATPAMLARTDHASAAEQAMLREVARRLDDYRVHMLALLRSQGLAAPLLAQWDAGAQAANALRAQLHNGALTWGEFNLALRDINTAQRLALADSADALEAHDEAAAERAGQAAREAYALALGQVTAVSAAQAQCEVIGNAGYCQ